MNDHSRFQELLALRLFGEADEAQLRSLDSHLTGCDSCRSLAARLDQGIGALLADAAADPLPADWINRLQRATASRPRPSLRPGLVAAAAFAAGVLITVLVMPERAAERLPPAVDRAAPGATAGPAFARATPPVPTPTRGFVALAGAAISRSGG